MLVRSFLACLAFTVFFCTTNNSSADTFTVDSLTTEAEPSPGDGICETPSGACTLIAAIQEAEQTPEMDIVDLTEVNGTISIVSIDITFPIELVGPGSGLIIEGINENIRWYGEGSIVSGTEFAGFRTMGLNGDGQTFSGNTIRDGAGISSTGAGNTIVDNLIYNTNSFAAIDVSANDGGLVRGNTTGFDDAGNPSPGRTSTGLRVASATGMTITDNTSHGYVAGFFLVQLSDSEISNNRIGDFGGEIGNGASVYHGIWAVGGVDNVYDANVTNGNALNGVCLGSCGASFSIGAGTGSIVTGHVANDNGGAGIRIENHSSATVMNSNFEGNAAGIVALTSGSEFFANRIVNNTGLAIDLFDDGQDNTGSADGATNPPTILNATGGDSFTVEGMFNDTEFAGASLELEFFISTSCAVNSEAEFYVGSRSVTADAGGLTSFSEFFSTAVAAGRFVTATATGPAGTSELAGCFEVLPGKPPEVDVEFYNLNAWTLNPRSLKPLLGIFLGSDASNVDDIDVSSLLLGAAVGSVVTDADVNEDGYDDLVVAFPGRDTGAGCGDTELVLTGEISGMGFERLLEVRVVGCRGKANLERAR